MSCFGNRGWTVNEDEELGLWNQTAWVQTPPLSFISGVAFDK